MSCLMQVSFWWQVACRTDIVGKKLPKPFEKPSIILPQAFPLFEAAFIFCLHLKSTPPISHKSMKYYVVPAHMSDYVDDGWRVSATIGSTTASDQT